VYRYMWVSLFESYCTFLAKKEVLELLLGWLALLVEIAIFVGRTELVAATFPFASTRFCALFRVDLVHIGKPSARHIARCEFKSILAFVFLFPAGDEVPIFSDFGAAVMVKVTLMLSFTPFKRAAVTLLFAGSRTGFEILQARF